MKRRLRPAHRNRLSAPVVIRRRIIITSQIPPRACGEFFRAQTHKHVHVADVCRPCAPGILAHKSELGCDTLTTDKQTNRALLMSFEHI